MMPSILNCPFRTYGLTTSFDSHLPVSIASHSAKELILGSTAFLAPFLFVASIVFTGCGHVAVSSKYQEFLDQPREVRVLLMPIDIELSELSAAGMLEPKAEWTVRATDAFTNALRKELKKKNASLRLAEIPADNPAKAHTYYQLLKLHDTVAQTIMTHQFNARLRLPTKNGELDWGLGPGVHVLHEDYDADYALFIDIQDIYVSKARVGLMVLAAALQLNPFLLINIPGFQEGYISLIDLENGDLVWFHQFSKRTGDLRDHESALDVVEDLLEDFHDEP